MVDRPKRVPPPPPPGFGDEDYYKLYGEPEEYQRYRRELTEKLKWKGDSPPQHEEYSVYRRYKSYEESYDYYCGPRQGELDGREGGRVPPKRRIAPPPPPGFEDSPGPRGAKAKKRVAPPPPSPSRRGKGEEEGSASGSEACEVFKNFRVTIKNDSDGTPSLSDSDEDMDRKGKKKRKRKRKEREREKRKKLEKKLKKREEELKAVKEKRLNSEPDLRDEIMQRRDESAGKGKKLSVIERLGERPPPGDRADLRDMRLGRDGERRGGPEPRGGKRSPIRRGSQEKSRREDLIRRAELRKDRPDRTKNSRDRGSLGRKNRSTSLGRKNRSVSPRKNRGLPDSRNRGRRRKSLSLGRKSKSTGRRSRSPVGRSRSIGNRSKSIGNRSKSIGNRSKSKGNIRRNSKSKDRRSLSDLMKKRSLSKGRSASRNRRRRNRSRTPLKRAGDRRGNAGRGRRKKRKKKRKRGDLSRNDKLRLEDMKEENEEMQAKLMEKRKKGGGNQEGLLGRLAEMAGMGDLPDTFKSEDGKSRKKSGSQSRSSSSDDSSHSSGSSSEDEYDSESGSESDEKGGRKGGNSGKRDKRFFWEKEAKKLKSDVVKKGRKNSGKSAKDNESDKKDLKVERSPDLKKPSGGKWKHDKFMESQQSPKKEREEAFGSHWSKIRSERSKERERNKSSRSRSRSRSRSTPRRSRKRKRRGKFSRSRSSSESSRSRSWSSSRHSSYSSRSETKSRSKSPKKKGASSPAAATTSKKAKDPEVVAVGDEKEGEVDKEGVNLGLSGALTADSNTVNGVVVKYCEPQEARKPKKKWRLYVFKGNEELPILYIHRQSAYLLGRDRKVADVPLDHPSCSKQHAALQYRLVNYTREDGTAGRRVQLYVMDLGSANGTFVNNSRIESQKYIQLLEKDVLKYGFSSREYVLLHDQSKVDLEEDEGLD